MHRRKLLFLVWLALLAGASEASANGRYPRSMKLIVDPTNPEHLVVSGTYGLAASRDGGQSWRYICEGAFSDPDTITDPLIAFTQDGTLYTGTHLHLRRSDPDLCEFEVVLGQEDELVPDYTLDVDGQSLLAVVSKVVDGKDQATVQASPDGGSWEPLGAPIEERSVLTLDVAPSDGQRLYVTALAPEVDADGIDVGRGVLLVSRDRGESFEELDIPGTSVNALPFIAAVHPTDPDVLYVRLNAKKENVGLDAADDALLVSRDAGQSFVELIRKPARLFAFALSPDAKTVMAGFGEPDDKTVVSESSAFGFYRITGDAIVGDGRADSFEVEQLADTSEVPAYCVTWTDDGLYLCVRGFTQETYEIGFTDNDEFSNLNEAKKLLYLADFEGPAACPSGSEAAVCATRWEIDCERLQACESPAAGAGGGAGASGGAGEGESPEPSNCGCRFISAKHFSAGGGVLACVVLGWLGWRRRRVRRRRYLERMLQAAMALAVIGCGGSQPEDEQDGQADPFSFFYTSLEAMRRLSGSDDGFGGDLRFGMPTGIEGADRICQTIAEDEGFGQKTWRAFLSAVEGPDGRRANAIERIGDGPWYDRRGRLIAANISGLIQQRPAGDPETVLDLPDESGLPTSRLGDTHNVLTGSNKLGLLSEFGGYDPRNTCMDWTDDTLVRVTVSLGAAWSDENDGVNNWIQAHLASSCRPGVDIEARPDSPISIGSEGGWGGFYCFALSP